MPSHEHSLIDVVIHMNHDRTLASGSRIRAKLLQNAGLSVRIEPPKVDEESIRAALEAEEARPRDVADVLAESKARKIALKNPGERVLGCDQVLEFDGIILNKPPTAEDARAQLSMLRGKTHRLLSAAVLYEDAAPVWRHVSTARLSMRDFSDAYLDDYVARNWPGIGESVGGYKLEEEGVRLFSVIQGDHFTILGLPLLELLNNLSLRKVIPA